jgi:hypothetical protein
VRIADYDGGWVGVDLDGTLAVVDERRPYDPACIGNPIEPIVRRVRYLLSRGVDVRIFTARVASDRGQDISVSRRAIESWCLTYLGVVLPITCAKDYLMKELWDDRAIQIISNEGIPVQTILAEAVMLLSAIKRGYGRVDSDLRDRVDAFLGEHDATPYVEEL